MMFIVKWWSIKHFYKNMLVVTLSLSSKIKSNKCRGCGVWDGYYNHHNVNLV